jgi:hypothetical protein
MRGGKITLQEVEGYVGSGRGLRKDLQDDFRDNRMLAEADLEACIYRHLREFLNSDKSWRIFVRAFAKDLGRYPDLTILDGNKRRVAIELKWRRDRISKKDRGVLNKFLDTPHARKAYFITTVRNKSDYRKLGAEKTQREKYRLKEIAVALNLRGSPLRSWEAKRRSIRAALK